MAVISIVMSDKSSSEERGNNYSVDPVIAAAFLEIYQQLDQLKKDLIFEKSGREILEKYVDRLLEVSDRHIIELEVLRRRLDLLIREIFSPSHTMRVRVRYR